MILTKGGKQVEQLHCSFRQQARVQEVSGRSMIISTVNLNWTRLIFVEIPHRHLWKHFISNKRQVRQSLEPEAVLRLKFSSTQQPVSPLSEWAVTSFGHVDAKRPLDREPPALCGWSAHSPAVQKVVVIVVLLFSICHCLWVAVWSGDMTLRFTATLLCDLGSCVTAICLF